MRKLKNTIKRAITLGLAAVLLTGSIPTAAFAARTEGSEQEMIMYGKLLEANNEGFTDNGDDTYTIRTAEGWTAFAESVTNGTAYSGKTVKLASDITISTMAGSGSNRFKGTFDGGGHTLTVTLSATSNDCAPFGCIEEATIRDLNIAGSVTTSAKYGASLAAHTYGTTNIENCHSTVTITSNATSSGDGTHAGFVAVNEGSATLSFSGCSFKGKLLGSNATSSGGFVGWNSGTGINYTNCLFAPAQITMSDTSSATFNRNGKNTFNHTYYVQTFGTTEGVRVYTSAPGGVMYATITAVDGQAYYAPVTVSGVYGYYKHTGSEIKPEPTVTAADGTVLTKDDHYTVTWSGDGTTIGDYTLTVMAKDGSGYSGSQTLSFTVVDDNLVTAETTTMTNAKYIVKGEVTITDRITVNGTVTLHLDEGATLYATKGITVAGGEKVGDVVQRTSNHLIIEGEGTLNADMSQSGTVKADDQPNAAAIGGGLYTYKSGSVTTAEADAVDYQSWCGSITINSGTVYAKSGKGPGIGTSFTWQHIENSGGAITINGGTVTAITTQNYTAGIGGCAISDFGDITINGGRVIAESKYGASHDQAQGAAIGGGGWSDDRAKGSNGTITINGGQITATNGYTGLGAGHGYDPNGTLEVKLGWTDEDDYIELRNVNAKTLKFNKGFVTEGNNFLNLDSAAVASQTKLLPAMLVKYDTGESDTVIHSQGIVSGTLAQLPATVPVPRDESLAFAGWMNGDSVYDFLVPVTADLTLTAAYKKDFTISDVQHLYEYTGSAVNLGYHIKNGSGSELGAANYETVIKNSAGETVTSVVEKDNYTLIVTGKGDYDGVTKTAHFAVAVPAQLGDYKFASLGENTYGIGTPELLEDLAAYVNGGNICQGLIFKLTGDIAFDINIANNHVPIGIRLDGSNKYFDGTFDGCGHTISGIRINTANDRQSLFGATGADSIIRSVRLVNCEISCGDQSGTLVGENNATITDCMVSSDVIISPYKDNCVFLGGIVGRNVSGNLSGCISAATISQDENPGNYWGGLVGYNQGSIRDSIFTGSLGNDNRFEIGWLTAYESKDASIVNCYYTGSYSLFRGIKTNDSGNSKYSDLAGGYAFTINGGDNVTVDYSGNPTRYTTSGIDAYSSGIKYDGKLYATTTEYVSLSLEHGDAPEGCVFNGYTVSYGKLSGTANPYTLSVFAKDAVINAQWAAPLSAQVFGHTLTLNGQIGVNTYFVLDSKITGNSGNYQVEFWTGETMVSSKKVSEVTPTVKEVGGNSYTVYGFTFTTVAKEADTTFTTKIKEISTDRYLDFANSDGTTVAGGSGLDYCINTYLDDRIENSQDEKMKSLAKNMKAYGIYAKHYFDVRDKGSTEALPSVEGFESITADAISAYAYTLPGNIDHFTYKGTTLVLEDKTSFRMYFESDDTASLSISVAGQQLPIRSGKGMYYVEIGNIAAKDLDEMYDFTISNGTESTTGHHGPMGYAYWALSSSDNESLKYTMMALYQYNRSAKDYFNN